MQELVLYIRSILLAHTNAKRVALREQRRL
jgi:hypothetical protein